MFNYIRVEAVNIYNSILETDQISVIRGGSLLLKKAVEDIALKFEKTLKPITTGASIGVFRVEKNNDGIKVKIVKFLNDQEGNFAYFTFIVEECEAEKYQDAKEILISKCRNAQLQQLSVSADYHYNKEDDSTCELDGVRPYFKIDEFPDNKDKKVSAFVSLKRKYGIDQRGSLYKSELDNLGKEKLKQYELDETGNLLKLKYTKDFEELSHTAIGQFKSLNNKIALIYFDGNSFSSIQERQVNTDEHQIEFDQKIKTLRRRFLHTLLQQIVRTNLLGWKTTGGNIRLETLLWGGDEMLFVVPAWKGFELLSLFYQESANWKIQIGQQKEDRLTHAGGIVFCNRKTPIYKIRHLAQELADGVKEKQGGRKGNFFDYLVLESEDYPAEPLSEFYKIKYNNLSDYRGYLKFIEPTEKNKKVISNIRQYIPRSQMYAIAKAACEIKIKNEESRVMLSNENNFQEQVKRLIKVSIDDVKASEVIDDMVQMLEPASESITTNMAGEDKKTIQQANAWLNLTELWDYLIVDNAEQGVEL